MNNVPRICTVISCGQTKQDLETGQTVPARELYTSPVHTCKDRYGRHSHGYFIASAEFGLVEPWRQLPAYDTSLNDLSSGDVRQWARDVVDRLAEVVDSEQFDAVVLVGGRTYTEPVVDQARSAALPVAIHTPWQTLDHISGVGTGMAWCSRRNHWPTTLSEIDETILGPARNANEHSTLDRWV